LRRAHIKGRSVELELEGGLRLPVSRTALPLLRERGWLADDVARQDGQVS
jgi:predicted transcriptional regulator